MKDKYLRNVSTLELHIERCTGCGRCLEVCPHQVFKLKDSKTEIIHKDDCMECGACVKNCPVEALEVKKGVGCALAVVNGWLTGGEPNCDCSGSGDDVSCC